ncbi:hypothetical protein PISMIDRAFT_688483 [Pisolithus microcarpus 441]|uniref:Uncharacterized protein n=1 Tax=Pisolithus microcarpus 441 TaxID=765257 RepID=A0A0C9Y9U6_9AGAM|nr:hypothetical protein PISMIDRAFT_688483 [Pisolithus microcarpus 441]
MDNLSIIQRPSECPASQEPLKPTAGSAKPTGVLKRLTRRHHRDTRSTSVGCGTVNISTKLIVRECSVLLPCLSIQRVSIQTTCYYPGLQSSTHPALPHRGY